METSVDRKVVSLCTLPTRIDTLKKTLDSLFNQTVKPDAIYLHVSFRYDRLDGISMPDESLKELKGKYPSLTIQTLPDYGPISKLFIGLLNEQHPDTSIITCDDDVIYNATWFEDICNNGASDATGYRGRAFRKQINYSDTQIIESDKINKETKVDILTGVRGCKYKRGLFEADFIDRWEFNIEKHPVIFYNDDIWISGCLAERGVARTVFTNTSLNSKPMNPASRLCKDGNQVKRTNQQIQLFSEHWRKDNA